MTTNRHSEQDIHAVDDVLERELTCAICTEILFDPVTFLNCLHTHCGSCAKNWFDSQTRNSAPPLYSCPVCRKRVRRTKANPTVFSLLDAFLRLHPEKDRTPAEKEELRAVWKAGQPVLPVSTPAVLSEDEDDVDVDVELHTARGRRFGGELVRSDRRIVPIPVRPQQEVVVLAGSYPFSQRARAPSVPSPSTPASSPASAVSLHTQRSASPLHIPSALRDIIPLGRQSRASSTPHTPPPPPPSQPHSPRAPALGSIPRAPSSPAPPTPPTTLLQILTHSTPDTPIHISCDTCHTPLSTATHHECTVCPLFHLCLRCARTSPHPHPTILQRLTPSWPRHNLSSGLFCTICSTFLDAPHTSFWSCTRCNPGAGWEYCTRCVQTGWVCTHELTLHTSPAHPPTHPLLRGSRTPAAHRLPPAYAPVTHADAAPVCAVCSSAVPANAEWIRCLHPPCRRDVCTTCFYNAHRTFPSARRARSRFLECDGGHAPAGVLVARGRRVLHCSVGAQGVPRPRAPEWCGARRSRGVAVRGYWPGEAGAGGAGQGGRVWGEGQWLCFPRGAEVVDVVVAFREGDREWCWGSYTGVGGLFPREMVRLVEEGEGEDGGGEEGGGETPEAEIGVAVGM